MLFHHAFEQYTGKGQARVRLADEIWLLTVLLGGAPSSSDQDCLWYSPGLQSSHTTKFLVLTPLPFSALWSAYHFFPPRTQSTGE